ncbi:MAG TPA: flavodoxin [Tenuifilaceae bacterium]|nr:flavodoxin [Tenuifilaceae bacterium]
MSQMKTAIVYSHSAKKTALVANQIKAMASMKGIEDLNVDELSVEKLMDYDRLIIGVSTWFDGELPRNWDELVPAIEDLNFNNKKVAIFGNGNQVGYPENFGDAVGIMADLFESLGAEIIGKTSIEGYTFEASRALRGKFLAGLVLDFENQHQLNEERIKSWVNSL